MQDDQAANGFATPRPMKMIRRRPRLLFEGEHEDDFHRNFRRILGFEELCERRCGGDRQSCQDKCRAGQKRSRLETEPAGITSLQAWTEPPDRPSNTRRTILLPHVPF
jgi:hypothetical protein